MPTLNVISKNPRDTREAYTNEAIFSRLVELGWQNSHEKLDKLGNGAKANVYRISKPDMVIRIPNEETTEMELHKEKNSQESFFYGLEMGKSTGRLPQHVSIPYIWNDHQVNTNLPEWVIVMEYIRGKTLLFYKISEILKQSGAILKESNLDGMIDSEILAKYPEIEKKLNIYDYKKALQEILGPKETENFELVISYLNKYGLSHQDIHLGNIMIQKNKGTGKLEKIYLIDFGHCTISSKSHSIVHEGRKIYEENLANSTKPIEFIS